LLQAWSLEEHKQEQETEILDVHAMSLQLDRSTVVVCKNDWNDLLVCAKTTCRSISNAITLLS